MGSWSSRVALISGASAGIGAATAVALGAKGCAVTLLARRRDRLDAVAAAGADRRRPGPRRRRRRHRGRRRRPRRRRDASPTFGSLDIVVANAGAGFHGSLLDTSPDAMARLMDLNYMGTFLLARAALPHLLRAPRASLVIVSSIVGRRGLGWGGAYAATKFAQVGLAESLRVELAGTPCASAWSSPSAPRPSSATRWRASRASRSRATGPRQSAEHVARAIVARHRAAAGPRSTRTRPSKLLVDPRAHVARAGRPRSSGASAASRFRRPTRGDERPRRRDSPIRSTPPAPSRARSTPPAAAR